MGQADGWGSRLGLRGDDSSLSGWLDRPRVGQSFRGQAIPRPAGTRRPVVAQGLVRPPPELTIAFVAQRASARARVSRRMRSPGPESWSSPQAGQTS